MTKSIIEVSKIKRALSEANTPEQTREIEAIALAAKAWAKEHDNYEMTIAALHTWMTARRKTTALIQPHIKQGRPNKLNKDVKFLNDFNLTYMQWNRRVKELEISDEDLDAYFDDCIAKQWEPSLFGLSIWKSNGGAHVSYNTGENEWYTPPEYIVAAREVLGGIDLDPASSDKANEIVGAAKYYTKHNSGLDAGNEWSGRVWMNPPYSSGLIEKFIKRYAYEVRLLSIESGMVLVNNATETEWFEMLVRVSNAIVFPTHRIKFIDMNGNATGAPLQGQAILYHGKRVKKFLSEFSKFGWSASL